MSLLPVALTPKRCLLIGSGQMAKQKAAVLEASGFEFVWCDDLEESTIAAYDLIIDASGETTTADRLVTLKTKHRFWLNVVDRPKLCDFYFCATAARGDLQVAVTSGGASPLLAQSVRDRIDRLLPDALRNETALLKQLRSEGKRPDRHSLEKKLGKALLIGCGPGRVDHLTLCAFRAIGTLEVALFDALIAPEVLKLLPEKCLRIDVSKEKGRHSMPQEAINALILEHVRAGKTVGRLKSGDPVVFGRVAEEVLSLADEGVECEVIAGVSSALAACSLGGIYPTARGVASSFSIVSAHLRQTRFNAEWLALLKRPEHTVIVLMAHSFAERIEAAAQAEGIDPATPAAFVSRIDRADQKSVIGKIGDLKGLAAQCEKPAVLILGNFTTRSDHG